jgi:hypothetical protein
MQVGSINSRLNKCTVLISDLFRFDQSHLATFKFRMNTIFRKLAEALYLAWHENVYRINSMVHPAGFMLAARHNHVGSISSPLAYSSPLPAGRINA